MTTTAPTCPVCHRALFSDGTCPRCDQIKPSEISQCHAGGYVPIRVIPQDLEDEALEDLRKYYEEMIKKEN